MSRAFQNGRWGNWFALRDWYIASLLYWCWVVLMILHRFIIHHLWNTNVPQSCCQISVYLLNHFLADVAGQMCCHPAGVGWANRWLIVFSLQLSAHHTVEKREGSVAMASSHCMCLKAGTYFALSFSWVSQRKYVQWPMWIQSRALQCQQVSEASVIC